MVCAGNRGGSTFTAVPSPRRIPSTPAGSLCPRTAPDAERGSGMLAPWPRSQVAPGASPAGCQRVPWAYLQERVEYRALIVLLQKSPSPARL